MARPKKRARRIATEIVEGRPVDYIELKNGSCRLQLRPISFWSSEEKLYGGHNYGPNSELGHLERFFLEEGKVRHEKVSRDTVNYKTKPSAIGSTYYCFT